jgi:hypothetical protein
MYKLLARPGWGSVLVEAQLAWYDLPHQIEEVDDLFVSAAARVPCGHSTRWRKCRHWCCRAGR